MAKIQTYQSHTAHDPLSAFVLAPIFVINLVVMIDLAWRTWPHERYLHLWLIVVAVALLLIVAKMRAYSTANQDRIIRLEERLRIATLVPLADLSRLSTRQLVALRFCPDGELPALVSRTLKEGLEAKAIKQNIKTWRQDDQRV